MQSILFKTFLDKDHEYVDTSVMVRPESEGKGNVYKDSLYEAFARSEKEVRRYIRVQLNFLICCYALYL